MNRNKWVVITGASSGIGKALAFEFAARAYGLFLTGRSADALEEVAAECRSRFAVETRTCPADLSAAGGAEMLIEALTCAGVDYEILVNNAGFGVKGTFAATDLALELDLVHVQLAAMLRLTKALLPSMIRRGSGRILNVASVYSFAPVPQQSVYGACKAFLLAFSEALNEELKDTGVTVTALCPGATQTKFRSRAGIVEKDKTAGTSAQTVARIAVDAALRGESIVIPGLVNRAFVFLTRHLPVRFVPPLVNFINNRRGVNH